MKPLTRWKQRVSRLWAADYCPVYVRWNPFAAPDAGRRLRGVASRHQFRSHSFARRWTAIVALTATWPLRALRLTWHGVRKYGPEIAARSGAPLWRQSLEQCWFAFRDFLPPSAYYHYELYRPERQLLASQYLHQHEAASLLPYLNCYHQHPAIDDKWRFTRMCHDAGLPVAPLLAVCVAGRFVPQPGAAATDPACDLFIKPVSGARGEGAMLWRHLEKGQYQDLSGTALTWSELIEHLKHISSQRAYLVQPRLLNHPDVAALSTGALCTARIVTGRTPSGQIEVVAATFKMPWSNHTTDTHGLSSPIELETGRLGRACSYRLTCPGYDAHPDTKAPIAGRTLPHWKRMVAVAQGAHALFPAYVFLGWDVALTTRGVCLLEGNAGWDVMTVQKPQRTPLAHTRLATICSLWKPELAGQAKRSPYR